MERPGIAESLRVHAVESIDHQATLSRSLEDFSAISPAMQRVVRGYHGGIGSGPDAVVNGTTSSGGFDYSVFSPHPSPTVESRPHRSSSYDTLGPPLSNGGSHSNPASATGCRGNAVAQQQSVVGGVDRTLAALFAVGIAVILAIILILLGQDGNATVTGSDIEPGLNCVGHC